MLAAVSDGATLMELDKDLLKELGVGAVPRLKVMGALRKLNQE
jgi:hypothetical protein